jgi:hypothetical protein
MTARTSRRPVRLLAASAAARGGNATRTGPFSRNTGGIRVVRQTCTNETLLTARPAGISTVIRSVLGARKPW